MGEGEDHDRRIAPSTAFPENQMAVPANWEKIIAGRIQGGRRVMRGTAMHFHAGGGAPTPQGGWR
jgi:hypothetical protein